MATTRDIITVANMPPPPGLVDISVGMLEDIRLHLIDEGRHDELSSAPAINAIADMDAGAFAAATAGIRAAKAAGPEPVYDEAGGATVGDYTIMPLKARHLYAYAERGAADVLRDTVTLTEGTALEDLPVGDYHALRRAITFLFVQTQTLDGVPSS